MSWQCCPSSVRPSSVRRPSVTVNNFGVATITQTNFIRSVSNFGNRKVPRKYRSSSNMSKIGQPELGYLPLNFFNFPHFRGVATITRTNIIRSVSNFGNRKVHRKYRSSSNMSKIGQPELGYLPLKVLQLQILSDLFQTQEIQVKFEYVQNRSTGTGLSALEFLQFFPFSRCCNDNSNKYYPICFKLWKQEGPQEIQVKFEYEQNRSTGTGLSALEFLQFSPFSRCCNDNSNKYYPICFKLWKQEGLGNTGQVRI